MTNTDVTNTDEIKNSTGISTGLPSEDVTFQEKPYLTILYQDEYLVAVDKPAGLFVHKSFMDKHEIYFALQLVRDQIGQYVYPVHRLDRPTSGVLLFALTKEVARIMGEYFASKSEKGNSNTSESENRNQEVMLSKTYFALVRGHLDSVITPSNDTLIDYPLKEKLDKIGDKFVNIDKPAQTAQTYFRVVKQASIDVTLGKYNSVRYSLVQLKPITGRRHQIRRHLAHLRYPIIGDINYGDNKQNPFFIKHFGFKRLMLIAKNLSFVHPITKEWISIDAEFDTQWQQVFTELNWTLPTT